jgi:hypothetical protein
MLDPQDPCASVMFPSVAQDPARELGFREVVVIDDDLGISGAGHRERPLWQRCAMVEWVRYSQID